MRITISKENYLKAIAEAESEGENVKAVTLSRWLDVSAPAVTMAIKRLKRDDLILVGREAQITLTDTGREIANRLLHRHHLIERMLAEIFGMEWYQVHDEAERLEHAVSPAFEAKLIEKLGEKGTCPHGNAVLPESPQQRKKRGMIQLSDAPEGADYVVSSLYERDPKLLLFLHKMGIGPQSSIRIVSRNYDQTVSVVTAIGASTLGGPAADKVWVKRKQ